MREKRLFFIFRTYLSVKLHVKSSASWIIGKNLIQPIENTLRAPINYSCHWKYERVYQPVRTLFIDFKVVDDSVFTGKVQRRNECILHTCLWYNWAWGLGLERRVMWHLLFIRYKSWCPTGWFPDSSLVQQYFCGCDRRCRSRQKGKSYGTDSVSYTHLDVYKRQLKYHIKKCPLIKKNRCR